VIKSGLAILEAIRQFGLVLAPEIIVWTQSLKDGHTRTITLRQRRICFTELVRDEVEEHGERFGPFSIELSIESLRRLGGLPVIYMPQHLRDDERLSSVGSTLVAELQDVKYTISQLQELSQLGGSEVVVLANTDEHGNHVALYRVSLENIQKLLSFIGYRNAPFELMLGALNHMQSLFYPTDDDLHDKPLEYYRQREWRLVQGLVLEGQAQARPLTDSEKEVLLQINERFWSKELSDGSDTFRRVDDAFVIDTFDGSHITELISAVLAPPEAFGEARTLFGERVQVLGGPR
jgi:hypothetical protein